MKILLLHSVDDIDNLRKVIEKRTFAFLRYSPEHEYTLHHHEEFISEDIKGDVFDLIIFDFTFLSQRNWVVCDKQKLDNIKGKYSFLSSHTAVKVAFPQDDFSCCHICDDWMYDLGINIVFSPSARFASKLYPKTQEKAIFHDLISGLVDDSDIAVAERYYRPFDERHIDVGYRANALKASFGAFAQLKGVLGNKFEEHSKPWSKGLVYDFSNSSVFLNDDWMNFLSNCKFMLGMKGGASIIDYRGEITMAVDTYIRNKPEATYEEIRQHCFPEYKENIIIANNTPRIFEYAIAKNCQILIEDDYFDGFNAGTHYIALKKDFSNIGDVMKQMQDRILVENIISNAYDMLILSGKYHYKQFLGEFFNIIAKYRDDKEELMTDDNYVRDESEELSNMRHFFVKNMIYHVRKQSVLNEQITLYKREIYKQTEKDEGLKEEVRQCRNEAIVLQDKLRISTGLFGGIRELLGVNKYLRGDVNKKNLSTVLYLTLNKIYKMLFV